MKITTYLFNCFLYFITTTNVFVQSPRTGDANQLILWGIVGVASFISILIIIALMIKVKNRK